jgi:tripartite-type tricarboxylate transporter receptor subunit TctC
VIQAINGEKLTGGGMLNPRSCLSILCSGLVVAALGMSTASAQNYPGKPIRIVVPGAGSSQDITARLFAQAIAGPLGQPVIVESRPAGVMAGQLVSQSAPDGYNLVHSSSALWLVQFLQDTTPFDVIRDFLPITQTTRSPTLLVVHPNLPVKSAKELIALAKARPGALNYASGSTGSIGHLAAELFQSMAGVRIVRVAYKSGAAAMTDVMSGEVQVMFPPTVSVVPHVKSGRLKALGVTSAQPTNLVPGIPTVAATGLPGFEAVTIAGIFAPAKTPRAIIDRLNQEIARALSSPEVRDKFLALGVEPVGGSPEQLEAAVKAEMATMGKLIKDLGIRE